METGGSRERRGGDRLATGGSRERRGRSGLEMGGSREREEKGTDGSRKKERRKKKRKKERERKGLVGRREMEVGEVGPLSTIP